MRLLIANERICASENQHHYRSEIIADLSKSRRLPRDTCHVKSDNEPSLKSVTAIATRDVKVCKFAPVNNNLWSLKAWVGQRRLNL